MKDRRDIEIKNSVAIELTGRGDRCPHSTRHDASPTWCSICQGATAVTTSGATAGPIAEDDPRVAEILKRARRTIAGRIGPDGATRGAPSPRLVEPLRPGEVTLVDAARLLGVHESTFSQVHAPRLSKRIAGRRHVFMRDEVERYAAARRSA